MSPSIAAPDHAYATANNNSSEDADYGLEMEEPLSQLNHAAIEAATSLGSLSKKTSVKYQRSSLAAQVILTFAMIFFAIIFGAEVFYGFKSSAELGNFTTDSENIFMNTSVNKASTCQALAKILQLYTQTPFNRSTLALKFLKKLLRECVTNF